MAQIRESRFIVRAIDEDDITLADPYTKRLVIIEREYERYSEEMIESFSHLEEGDIIDAQIQSEDVLQPNAVWWVIGWEYPD